MLVKPIRSILLFLVLFSAILKVQVLTGCANIIPPSGGPRDSIPPQLVSATPPDSTTNFTGDRIQLTFDEYIDLKEVQNNLLFTPTFEENPEVSVRAKTVTIRFRDTLEPHTTYIFNFGNALVDYTEGNAARNFVYTFSTGPVIDSLSVSGRVVLAENGKTDSTLIVMLHRNLSDSAVVKERPMYVARLDANGRFRFRNLPQGTFAIYALGEGGLARRYQNRTQLFAFFDSPVVTGTTDSITLYAYRETPSSGNTMGAPGGLPKIAATERRLQYTAGLTNNQLELTDSFRLTFATPLRTFDSALIALQRDSTYTPVPVQTSLDSSRKILTVHTAWQESTPYYLILNRAFAEDTAGRRLLKTDTIRFTTKSSGDYGNLVLRMKNLPQIENPVLQLIQGDRVIRSEKVVAGVVRLSLFPPGEYELRLLSDTNDNGLWDPGQFFEGKRQPERVYPIERRITVRANWDNDFEITL